MNMYEELRSDIVRIGRLSYGRGHVSAAQGNISARAPDNRGMIIKVSGVSFSTITTDDLLFVDWDGGVYDCESLTPSTLQPSMELRFHSRLYSLDDETGAVVHLHSPYSTALSLNSGSGEIPLVAEESQQSLRRVPVIPTHPAGSRLLAEAVHDTFAEDGIVAAVICGHGPIAIGRTLQEAYNHVDSLEHNCMVAIYARITRLLGTASV
jgi:L-fuculose-phosphate aldolase